MPNGSIIKASEVCNKPLKDVEELFTQAEKLAEEQGKKGNYSYIMGIFKKSLGKECVDKLGWGSSEIKEFESKHFEVLNLIQELRNLDTISKIDSSLKNKICSNLLKESIIQENIKKFNLKNDVKSLCASIKIIEVKQDDNGDLFITIYPKNENSTNGYLGNHICDIECNSDCSEIYNISFNG